MKRTLSLCAAVLLFALPSLAQVVSYPSGPEGSVGFGVGTLVAPGSNSASGDHQPQTVGGGTYLNVSGDVIVHRNFGISGEVAWRASQNSYQGYQGFRPILYDFNAMYAPKLGKRARLELVAGLGGISSRFYNDYYTCDYYTCTNYSDSNHFMGDVGAGVRLYVTEHVFLRPEFRTYFIKDAWEYSSNHATRAGVTLGYSFGGHE